MERADAFLGYGFGVHKASHAYDQDDHLPVKEVVLYILSSFVPSSCDA